MVAAEPEAAAAEEAGGTPLQIRRPLLIRLSQRWPRYRLVLAQAQSPHTNNGCEQALGRFNVRSRSVRGFKRVAGARRPWCSAISR